MWCHLPLLLLLILAGYCIYSPAQITMAISVDPCARVVCICVCTCGILLLVVVLIIVVTVFPLLLRCWCVCERRSMLFVILGSRSFGFGKWITVFQAGFGTSVLLSFLGERIKVFQPLNQFLTSHNAPTKKHDNDNFGCSPYTKVSVASLTLFQGMLIIPVVTKVWFCLLLFPLSNNSKSNHKCKYTRLHNSKQKQQ